MLPRQILYVEDNLVNQLLMTEMITRCTTHKLHIARSMREGLRMASQQAHDLLLLDLRLPDGQGPDLLQMLRRLPAYADVPAVAVTAEYGFDPAGTGFCEVWFKPLDIHQTLDGLERVLRNAPARAGERTQPQAASLASLH
jgi:CheY-like chemotaxis protein